MSRKNTLLYAGMLLIAGTALFFLFEAAFQRHGSGWVSGASAEPSSWFSHSVNSTTILFCQILSILFLSFLITRLFRFIGQPDVIGEMTAGIMLGPSLLGLIAPEAYQFLFPPSSLPNLHSLSQLGLLVFLFLIGMEIDLGQLKGNVQSALLVSHASILLPFVLGVALALWLFPALAPPNVAFLSFGLFLGTAMSITAFPVLARIVQERGLMDTLSGRMAVTVAAVDDATAWCVLALVVALVKATGVASAATTIVLAVLYVLSMAYIVRPLVHRMGQVYFTREIVGRGVMAVIILLIIGSSLITELIGIHAFFGAFMAGVILPSDTRFRRIIAEKLEDFAGVILLPLFFAYTGVRTDFALVAQSGSWSVFFWVFLVAVAGKVGGGFIAARLSGISTMDALKIGVLINTRGLVELIVLNVGLDLGVISQELFSVMVLMALSTTFMTGPVLSLLHRTKAVVPAAVEKVRERIVFAFGPVLTGLSLLRLGALLRSPNQELVAVHLYPSGDLVPRADQDEGKIFVPLKNRAEEMSLELRTIEAVSADIAQDLCELVDREAPEILLVGGARSVFSRSRIGGKVGDLLRDCTSTVGIYVEKDLPREFKSAGILCSRKKDDFLFEYAARLRAAGIDVTVIASSEALMEQLVAGKLQFPIRLDTDVFGEFDLLLLSVPHWLEKRFTDPEWMDDPPCSLLLLRKNA